MRCTLCSSDDTKVFFKKEDKSLGSRRYFRCAVCQLIFLDEACRLSPSREKARYDFHQNDPLDERYVRFLERLAAPLFSRLKPGRRGLDFGCGPGSALAPWFKDRGHVMDAYDPYYSPDRAILEKKFDFVACSETAEHFYNPREAFLLIDRLLKDGGGVFGLMTGILKEPSGFSGWWYHRDPTHVSFYGGATLDWVARWRGWEREFPSENVVIYTKNTRQGIS